LDIVKNHLIVTKEVPHPYEEGVFRNGSVYLNKEMTDELEAEGVVIADLRAQTKLADATANPRSHALVNQFLDHVATAPIQRK